MFYSTYESLASNPTESNLWWLMYCSSFDERVYEVVARHKIVGNICDRLPLPAAAHFLSRGIVYDDINTEVMSRFIKICSLLGRYEGVEEGCALAELLGSCGYPEQNRLRLFNFSETFRHLALQNSYFPQRGMLQLLSLIFCDDVLEDAVATLQNKTDILNHVNRIFVKTADFVSWRYSVRVMSLAGGYNEDRMDVDRTEALCRFTTKAAPEFLTYFFAAFFYGMFRHYPQRVRGIVPKWLRRQRALFTGVVCGMVGVFGNSLLEYRLHKERMRYELRKSQEYRRRRGAGRRGLAYEQNTYFNSLEGITRRLYTMQVQHYALTAALLGISLLPITSITFPKWMGDVPFRFPMIPRLFPALVNMRTSSRCLIPYIVAPFTIVSIANSATCGVSLYDRYVEMRQGLFTKKHGLD